MSSFDERQNAFEAKYAHDEEMQFRAVARRNKMLGLWAAGLMGKTAAEAAEYAKTVVIADFEEAGHEDVVRKVKADLGDRVTEDEIRATMEELLPVAKAEIMSES